jgi:2',3'-cyclic-nucleotide 2'-phosphodiesterase
MTQYTNILFVGDVVGKPGRQAIQKHMPILKEKYKLDFIVINAENAAGGYGITHKVVKELFDAGADVLTLGDHAWDKPEADEVLENNHKVIRPINYPKGTPGKGFNIYTTDKGIRIGVTNLLGRTFMSCNPDCPFQASKKLQREYRMGEDYDIMLVDSHTEATSEAVCLGEIWDGKASMVTGTHTHIPTADAFIKPRGTLYQTDTGMTGVYNTSLGSDFDGAIKRFETARRQKLALSSGEGTVCALYGKIDNNTGKCVEFKMIRTGGVLPDTEV